MSDTMVDRRQKITKKTRWLKRPKAVPQKTKFVILFLKILFRACHFSLHVPMDIIRVFFIPDFVAKISKPIKTSEKDHSFYNTVSLKKTSLTFRVSTLRY